MSIQKYLDPKNDLAFKRIFGSEKNKDVIIHFLNAALRKEGPHEIEDVAFLENVVDTSTAKYTSGALNVLCRDKEGIKYIVGTRVAHIGGFETQARHYTANVYYPQMQPGQKYEMVKEVIFLAIADFIILPNQEDYISDHVVFNRKTDTYDLKDLSFTVLELPKFQKTNVEELENNLEKWCYFFKYSHNAEGMNRLIHEGNPVIEKAHIELRTYNWTDEELRNYEEMQKLIRDVRAREDFVREEGRAIGRAKARAAGKPDAQKQIIMELKSVNMDTSTIAQAVKLTEEEVIAIIKQ